MCTLTIQRSEKNTLITMNRDERSGRKAESPPANWNNFDILAPKDEEGGGTWIGIRFDNHWACLLNHYTVKPSEGIKSLISRGMIIPFLLTQNDPLKAIQEMDLTSFAGFRLVVGYHNNIIHVSWDCKTLTHHSVPQTEWMMVSSSSWEEQDVLAYRQMIYERWLGQGASFSSFQSMQTVPSFHLHQEKGKEAYGVWVKRPATHTTSITQITLPAVGKNRMNYWPAYNIPVVCAA